MASPVGHIIIGIGLGSATSRRRPSAWWLVFAAFAACAPDLDFLPGLLAGDVNRYHQLASHSLTAMVLFGVASGLAGGYFRGNPWRIGLGAALFYGSHLAVDLFTRDVRAPYGIPLFWPFYNGHFMAPWTVFGGVQHGVPGDSLRTFLGDLFSLSNLVGVGTEVAVLGPIAVLIWWWGRRRRMTASRMYER
ncbi:MAG: metal-dependent hydrolase [Arenicellales bacterium]